MKCYLFLCGFNARKHCGLVDGLVLGDYIMQEIQQHESLFVLQEVTTDVMCDYVFHFSIYIYHKKAYPLYRNFSGQGCVYGGWILTAYRLFEMIHFSGSILLSITFSFLDTSCLSC